MIKWPKMSEILEPRQGSEFSIVHYELSENGIRFEKLRDAINARRESNGQEPGIVVQLRNEYGSIMMSDTEMEKRTNTSFVYEANGDVLIGGLGLGMVLLAVQAKEEVNSVTVIEIEQEIISLVAPQLPLNEKVTIIRGDIFEWYPPKGILYDVIYFDIWNNICADDYGGMTTLHRRFGKRLNRSNRDCWMSSWRRYDRKEAYFESESRWRS